MATTETTGGGTITPVSYPSETREWRHQQAAKVEAREALLDGISRQDPALAETNVLVPKLAETPKVVFVGLPETETGILTEKVAEELRAWERAGLMLADLDALRARFVPAEGEAVTEDEFVQRGVDLVAVGRNAVVVLGELLQWKMDAERCEDEISRNAVIERYGPAWGVSTSRLWKAWVYVNRFPDLILPEDTSQTLVYEVMSGCKTREEAEEVLDRAIAEGWSVKDVREIKSLRSRGLLEGWVRLKILSIDNVLYVTADGGPSAQFALLGATVTAGEKYDLAQAAIALLEMRAGL